MSCCTPHQLEVVVHSGARDFIGWVGCGCPVTTCELNIYFSDQVTGAFYTVIPRYNVGTCTSFFLTVVVTVSVSNLVHTETPQEEDIHGTTQTSWNWNDKA